MGKYHMTLARRGGGKTEILVTLFDFTYYTIHYTTRYTPVQYTAIHCNTLHCMVPSPSSSGPGYASEGSQAHRGNHSRASAGLKYTKTKHKQHWANPRHQLHAFSIISVYYTAYNCASCHSFRDSHLINMLSSFSSHSKMDCLLSFHRCINRHSFL